MINIESPKLHKIYRITAIIYAIIAFTNTPKLALLKKDIIA